MWRHPGNARSRSRSEVAYQAARDKKENSRSRVQTELCLSDRFKQVVLKFGQFRIANPTCGYQKTEFLRRASHPCIVPINDRRRGI